MVRSSVVGATSDRRTPRSELASARSPVSPSDGSGRPAADVALQDELAAGRDAELREDLPHVIVDRARAEEQARGHLLVRRALGHEPRDLQLLRRQLVDRAGGALAGGLAARAQLYACALGPGTGAQQLERVEGGA